jgi:membrane protein
MGDRIRRYVARVNQWAARHRSTRITRATIAGFLGHEALQYAGAMAYFIVLSLVNVFILGVVAASYLVGEGAARSFVIDRVARALPVDPGQIGSLIDRAVAARGGVGIIGLALLLWSALGAFGALSSGISRVFVRAPKRAFWKDRLIGLALLAAIGILVIASVALGLATRALEDAVSSYLTVPGTDVLFAVVTLLIPVGLVFFAFLVVYRVVPNRPVTVGEAWPGALLATVLWTALRLGFTYYATRVAKYDTVFGPIGTAISILVFLYFSSVILLLGAELVRAGALEAEAAALAARQPAAAASGSPEPPVQSPG